ncbi:hypothetical protein EUGRSUZ_C02044 [Eucalyptus grandis]|uniref:Uncharacterized protein n=2 Tax=Eucalyptus grandis TaxID=71139 RepID=A0ACC3LEC6_EUCGR|nr:hypothetical protein EUGRSUZ_C02044 [Eucalyptus grandis]
MSCRAKLAQIVDCHKCHKTTGQIIMPVFFNVSPTVVKKGSSDYEKAIARHRQEDPKTLQEWKKALIHLGSISGGTSNRSGTDASLIDELVVNVLRVLNRYLVDIEHDVERVMELLDEKSSDVRVGTEILKGVLLEFGSCPWNLRAKNLDLEELVILDLSRSMVHEKWNGWIQIQKAKKLKVLNLTGCVHLIKTPDLSHFKCLERLILERCMRLDEIGPSVKSLRCLVSLNLRFCTELKKLPRELGSLTSLEDILIDETAIQEIPASIGDLQKLKRFSACNCLSLTQLPESISHVESLEVLALNGIEITKLPLSEELRVLQYLSISNCRKLPAAIWKLKRLEELHASGCRSLEGKIPKQIKMLSALRVLKLGYSRICGLPDSISGLPNLQTLDLLHCDQLREVPKLPSSLISLSVSSKLMDRIPDISSLVKLGELFLGEGSQEPVLPVRDKIEKKECTLQLGSLLELKILQLSMLKIQLLPVGLHYLYKLRKLSLCCIHLKKLPRLPPGLFTLSLHHCKSQTMPDLSYLVLLSKFELFNCAVTEVPGLGKFKSLRVFRASHCDLQQVDELENLIFLASLNVSYCRSLERLPDLSNLTMLKDIKIEGCLMIPDDFYYVDSHLNLSEEQSSSLIEADSPSEVTNAIDFPTGHVWNFYKHE